MDQYLNINLNISCDEDIHGVHEGNAYDEVYGETFEGINEEFREEINGRVHEAQGVYEESNTTYFSSSNYSHIEFSSIVQPIFLSNQQDNNHQLVNSSQATHEIINRYIKPFENPQLSAAVNESIDELRERFRQRDNRNLSSSSARSKVTTGQWKWSEEAANDLLFYLEEYKTFVAQLKTKHGNIKDKLWKHISTMLLKKGHNYSPKQCATKWKNIQQLYKESMNNSNNKTEFRYKSECEKILAASSGLNELNLSLDEIMYRNNSGFLNEVRSRKVNYSTFIPFTPKKKNKGRSKNN